MYPCFSYSHAARVHVETCVASDISTTMHNTQLKLGSQSSWENMGDIRYIHNYAQEQVKASAPGYKGRLIYANLHIKTLARQS